MYKTIQPPCGRWKCIPLWWLAPPPFPIFEGALQGSAKPCTHKSLYFKHGLFCSRLRGKSGAAGKGEASAASQSAELFSCHMTQKSKSRNVLASPLGEEGHEVAKGWTVVRMIMILDVDVTAERRHYNTHRPIGRYHNPRCQWHRQT